MAKTNLLFEAGYAIGDVPLTHLYNTSQITLRRNHHSKNHLWENSFDVLQWFSDEFVYFQLNMASTGYYFQKSKPSLVLWYPEWRGNLQKPEQHAGLNYKTLNEGYFESGIEPNF
jgi:hypothetical protein